MEAHRIARILKIIYKILYFVCQTPSFICTYTHTNLYTFVSTDISLLAIVSILPHFRCVYFTIPSLPIFRHLIHMHVRCHKNTLSECIFVDTVFQFCDTLFVKQPNQNELAALRWVQENYSELLGAEIHFAVTTMPSNVNGSYYRSKNLVCLRRHQQGIRFYVESLVHELTHSKQAVTSEQEAYAAGYAAGFKYATGL